MLNVEEKLPVAPNMVVIDALDVSIQRENVGHSEKAVPFAVGHSEKAVPFDVGHSEKAVPFAVETNPEQMLEKSEAAQTKLTPESIRIICIKGLQGSGKSTLARALKHLLGGVWINQDEFASKKKAKAAFLKGIEEAVLRDEKFLIIDKIFTQVQHRQDVLGSINAALKRKRIVEKEAAIVLLDLCHPADHDAGGDHDHPKSPPPPLNLNPYLTLCLFGFFEGKLTSHALSSCLTRIEGRGLQHRSLVPQAGNVESILEKTIDEAESLREDERLSYEMIAHLDLRKSKRDLILQALSVLGTIDGFLPQKLSEYSGSLDDSSCEYGVDAISTCEYGVDAISTSIIEADRHEATLPADWITSFWFVELDWLSVLTSPVSMPLQEALPRALSCLNLES